MDIYAFLCENGITFERHDHPAVFTCEEVDALVPELGGVKTKNLHRFMEASAHEPLILDLPARSTETAAHTPYP